MVDVVTEVVINRPLDEVAAYTAVPTHAPTWYVNIESVRWETEPAVAIGSRATFAARFLGHTLNYTYEIASFTPAEHLVMRTAEGPFPMETTYTWRPHGATSTKMTLRNGGRPVPGAARDPVQRSSVTPFSSAPMAEVMVVPSNVRDAVRAP